MSILLGIYVCIGFFFLGCFYCMYDADGSVPVFAIIMKALFFAAIWPVTILTYINIKLFDRRDRK